MSRRTNASVLSCSRREIPPLPVDDAATSIALFQHPAVGVPRKIRKKGPSWHVSRPCREVVRRRKGLGKLRDMENRGELMQLLSALCDEQLSDSEHARLQELLADDEARRVYLQYVDMNARLLTHPRIVGEGKLCGVNA